MFLSDIVMTGGSIGFILKYSPKPFSLLFIEFLNFDSLNIRISVKSVQLPTFIDHYK